MPDARPHQLHRETGRGRITSHALEILVSGLTDVYTRKRLENIDSVMECIQPLISVLSLLSHLCSIGPAVVAQPESDTGVSEMVHGNEPSAPPKSWQNPNTGI